MVHWPSSGIEAPAAALTCTGEVVAGALVGAPPGAFCVVVCVVAGPCTLRDSSRDVVVDATGTVDAVVVGRVTDCVVAGAADAGRNGVTAASNSTALISVSRGDCAG